MSSVLQPLKKAPSGKCPAIRPAQHLLEGGHRSTDDLLAALESIEQKRRLGNTSMQGRRADQERDLLRAAIVFSSSALDACLKSLIVNAGLVLIKSDGSSAQSQFRTYLQSKLAGLDPDWTRLIVDSEPDDRLVAFYLSEKSRGSLQATSDLKTRVRSLLGIPISALPDRQLTALNPFFAARNAIVHEMDFAKTPNPRSSAKTHREKESVVDMCNQAFQVSGAFITATYDVLRSRASSKM